MSVINIRVNDEVKKEVEAIYKEIGLNMSTAINLFLKKCILEQGIPFELKVPNKETMKAMEEVKKGIGLSKSFSDIKTLVDDLNA